MRFLYAILVASLGALLAAAGAPDPRESLKKSAEVYSQSFVKMKLTQCVDLTHPRAIELMGGRDKLLASLEASLKETKALGYEIRSIEVKDPNAPVSSGSGLYAIVPFQMEMKAPDGRLTQSTYMIGVSEDKGKTWTFVRGELAPKTIRAVLPELPKKFKLPKKQKPVLVKD